MCTCWTVKKIVFLSITINVKWMLPITRNVNIHWFEHSVEIVWSPAFFIIQHFGKNFDVPTERSNVRYFDFFKVDDDLNFIFDLI